MLLFVFVARFQRAASVHRSTHGSESTRRKGRLRPASEWKGGARSPSPAKEGQRTASLLWTYEEYSPATGRKAGVPNISRPGCFLLKFLVLLVLLFVFVVVFVVVVVVVGGVCAFDSIVWCVLSMCECMLEGGPTTTTKTHNNNKNP